MLRLLDSSLILNRCWAFQIWMYAKRKVDPPPAANDDNVLGYGIPVAAFSFAQAPSQLQQSLDNRSSLGERTIQSRDIAASSFGQIGPAAALAADHASQ
jgi:hypothetical protein